MSRLAATVRFDLKIFAASGNGAAPTLDPAMLVPVFHRWIREQLLDDLMVDVADYAHVPDGPGVVLVCHEGQYGLDGAGGELGLLYSRRRETRAALAHPPSLEDRLVAVLARGLTAALRLEREAELKGRVSFPGDDLLLRVNDRRVGGDDEATLRAAAGPLLARLFPAGLRQLVSGTAPDGRLQLRLRAREQPGLERLLERLGEPAVEVV